MAGDTTSFITRYGAAIEAFNRDDLGPMADLLADECVFNWSGGSVGGSKAEILEGLRAGRVAGWKSHNVVGIMAGGDFVVALFRNDYANGTSFVGAGVVRVDERGRATEFRTLEPADVVARLQASAV